MTTELTQFTFIDMTMRIRATVAQHAASVGQDFELHMGRHLGAIGT